MIYQATDYVGRVLLALSQQGPYFPDDDERELLRNFAAMLELLLFSDEHPLEKRVHVGVDLLVALYRMGVYKGSGGFPDLPEPGSGLELLKTDDE